MNKLKEKLKESFDSVLPITLIVLFLTMTIAPVETEAMALFLCGAVLLILGMGLFQLGAEIAMTPLGSGIGKSLLESRKLWLIILVVFGVGILITISEPDLQVLAEQVPSIPNQVLILTVALGVGIFLVAAVLRILFHIPLWIMLAVFYGCLFLLACFAPSDFAAVAFDSGGVTTGPMTVPFIMALGVGLSSARSDKEASDDAFGLIALSSIGPILMVFLLSIFYHPDSAVTSLTEVPEAATTVDVLVCFVSSLPVYAREVIVSMLPILGVFVVYQFITKRYKKVQIIQILMGFLYTIGGLILFLTGVNVGFAPVGTLLGISLGTGWTRVILVVAGALIGFFIVKAEPAVQVLNEQVEDITGGTISASMMNKALSIGVSAAVAIAMLRALYGFSLFWFLVPGYIIALVLTHFVPKVFVGVAFDAGGVASGPMASTFLLPLAIGVCTVNGGNVSSEAFGVIALVALAPLIAVQLMGLIYSLKEKKKKSLSVIEETGIIELEDLD